MNKKDFNPDFNDDDLLVDMTFKVVKFIFTIVAVLGVFIVFGRILQDSQDNDYCQDNNLTFKNYYYEKNKRTTYSNPRRQNLR